MEQRVFYYFIDYIGGKIKGIAICITTFVLPMKANYIKNFGYPSKIISEFKLKRVI
jgi:hypothetical protein